MLHLPIHYILESCKILTGMRAIEKKTKHIHASAADLLHNRIGSLDWCKRKHCKKEARQIDCLC